MSNAIHYVPQREVGELGDVYEPGWYFWDETWADRNGPYADRDEAMMMMDRYCREVLGDGLVKKGM